MSITLKRDTLKGRKIRRNIAAATVAEALGEITPGCEIFGLSKGQFSLVDIITHCLCYTGPADVVISTWTAANADLGFANELLTVGQIRTLRFIVDFSFPTRQPEYCAALRERFGDDALRVTKTHAKFVVICNAGWNIVIRSSMNLNENKRLESFEVSDHAGMAEFCLEVVDHIFEWQAAGKGFKNTPYQNMKEFDGLLNDGGIVDGGKASTDSAKYFSDDLFGTDLRRAGLTYTT